MTKRKRGEFYGTAAYRKLRLRRLAFDHYTCQACGATNRAELQVHHLLARGLGHESRDMHDYVTLCARCNRVAGQTNLTPAAIGALVGGVARPNAPRTIIFAARRRVPRVR